MIARQTPSRRSFYASSNLEEHNLSTMERAKTPRTKYAHRRQRSDETCNIQTKVRSMTLTSLGLPPQLRHGHHLRNSRRQKVGLCLSVTLHFCWMLNCDVSVMGMYMYAHVDIMYVYNSIHFHAKRHVHTMLTVSEFTAWKHAVIFHINKTSCQILYPGKTNIKTLNLSPYACTKPYRLHVAPREVIEILCLCEHHEHFIKTSKIWGVNFWLLDN